jgi:putative ABC transport system permease protein
VLWQWIRTSALAWRDIVHEWQVALCLILALAAVLTPLLVLFGLKSGIITTMTERLKADPRNLEVVLKGNNRLEPPWIEQVHSRPDVSFLVPRTRSLAATVSLIGSQGRSLSYVDMIPTANGDPILLPEMQAPAGLNEAILSHTVAVKLDVSEGGQVEGIVRRRLDGRPQAVEISLQIIGVLPEAAFGSDAVFVSLPLLVATEDYRDGHRIPELEVGEGRPPREGERSFAGVRLYARSLDDVAGVAAFLRAEGFDVATKAKDIETVKAIDRVLSFIFLVIAGVGVTGFLLSLSASLWANVDRKRRDLAMLRLVGLRTGPLLAFPAAQAFIVAIGGLALSAVLYFGISSLFNAALAADLQRDEFVCRLFIGDGLVAGLLTIIFALIASAVGGYRALKIDPAESLREL